MATLNAITFPRGMLYKFNVYFVLNFNRKSGKNSAVSLCMLEGVNVFCNCVHKYTVNMYSERPKIQQIQ